MKLFLLLILLTISCHVSPNDDSSAKKQDSITTATPQSTDEPSDNNKTNSSLFNINFTSILYSIISTPKWAYENIITIPQKVCNYTASFSIVTNFTAEIYENIEKLIRKVIIEESLINYVYKELRKEFGNLTDPELILDSILSILLYIICILLSYAAYVSSVSIFTILASNGAVILIQQEYGAKYIFHWLIYISDMIYSLVAWLQSIFGFKGLLAIFVALYIATWIYWLLQRRGYIPTTEHRVYIIATRLARMESQLDRMERTLNDMKNDCKKGHGKKKTD